MATVAGRARLAATERLAADCTPIARKVAYLPPPENFFADGMYNISRLLAAVGRLRGKGTPEALEQADQKRFGLSVIGLVVFFQSIHARIWARPGHSVDVFEPIASLFFEPDVCSSCGFARVIPCSFKDCDHFMCLCGFYPNRPTNRGTPDGSTQVFGDDLFRLWAEFGAWYIDARLASPGLMPGDHATTGFAGAYYASCFTPIHFGYHGEGEYSLSPFCSPSCLARCRKPNNTLDRSTVDYYTGITLLLASAVDNQVQRMALSAVQSGLLDIVYPKSPRFVDRPLGISMECSYAGCLGIPLVAGPDFCFCAGCFAQRLRSEMPADHLDVAMEYGQIPQQTVLDNPCYDVVDVFGDEFEFDNIGELYDLLQGYADNSFEGHPDLNGNYPSERDSLELFINENTFGSDRLEFW